MSQTAPRLPKVTYAAIPTEEMDILHSAYEESLGTVRQGFGESHSMFIGGQPVRTEEEFDVRAPADRTLLLGRFSSGTAEHARQAIEVAHAAFQHWRRMPYLERLTLLRAAADNFRSQKVDIAALLSIEAGKNRLEALGEVEEAADLISTYCDELEQNHGYVRDAAPLMAGERNVSVLRPFGVWAVVAPFNFPVALATGMIAGALVAGNTVVFKPASATPYTGLLVYQMFAEAGLPDGVINYITGGGGAIGGELATNPLVEGMVFTGSREIGSEVYRKFAEPYARPCITEMGGKNPTIVSASADLDKAAEGVMRSAFGYSGQKCSACSRVYVQREVHDAFVRLLVERTRSIVVGEPTEQITFMGPVINEEAVATYLQAARDAERDGEIMFGGKRLTDAEYANGTFVEPAIVGGLPTNHRLFREELFVPFLAVAPVASLE
ncbi:MAG: aldehyde dehydrogenase family protein, partial [Chloroflexota bacterium]|nr:aldehyde dehydrogenase family protein [Chloroflexota bacterium]